MYLNNKKIVTIEKMFINGVIYTMDDNNSIYETMGISQGKIVFLGNNNEAMNLINENTKIIDLNHKTVIPGFIDAYIKIPEKMIMKKDDLSLFECTNLDEYLNTIKDYVNTHIEKRVIYGCGWDFNKFLKYNDSYSYKGPHKNLLNNICLDKAIVLRDLTGHMLWLNDKAFKYYGITTESPSPIGGKIEHDEQGELWGTLRDNAVKLVDMTELSQYSNKNYLNRFMIFQKQLHSYGITSIGLVENDSANIQLDVYRLL